MTTKERAVQRMLSAFCAYLFSRPEIDTDKTCILLFPVEDGVQCTTLSLDEPKVAELVATIRAEETGENRRIR